MRLSQKKYLEAKKLIEGGMNVLTAVSKVKMSVHTYYKYKKAKGSEKSVTPVTRRKGGPRKTEAVEKLVTASVPVVTSTGIGTKDENVFIFIGPRDLAEQLIRNFSGGI